MMTWHRYPISYAYTQDAVEASSAG